MVEGGHLRLYSAPGELRLSEAEAQAQRAEDERRKVAKLAAALRRLGQDPDELIYLFMRLI